jgi:hypothetical protein
MYQYEIATMQLLKELLQLGKKKPTVKRADPATAGAKALNMALASKKGGGHYAAKTDYVRAKEKQKLRATLSEELLPTDE